MMAYQIAGIDVHKKMLAVVVADVDGEGEWQFERRQVGTSPAHLRSLADWLVERRVEEVVMESTAQYWRPVWEALERYWQPRSRTLEGARPTSGALHLAQSLSNRGPSGRKKDYPDAERLVKRLVAKEPFRSGEVPLVGMVSFSLVYHRGPQRFVESARAAGLTMAAAAPGRARNGRHRSGRCG